MTPEMSLNSAILCCAFLGVAYIQFSLTRTRSTLAVFLAIGILSCRDFVHGF